MSFKACVAALAVSLLAGTAMAADLANKKEPAPPPAPATPVFDFAFGGKIQSDYISRGITQTAHNPGVTAYGELRYNFNDSFQAYAGAQGWSVKLPTNPALEMDLYGGIRPTFGNLALDIGAIYYWYPGNSNQYWTDSATTTFLNPAGFTAATCAGPGFCATTARDPSYLEVYFKPVYNFSDSFNVGGNFFYSPNWNNYGFGETYVSGTAKYTFGTSGFSISGEFGREFLGTTATNSIFGRVVFRDYNTWNVGASYAWKTMTFDLRYYGTGLNSAQCYLDSSDPAGNRVGAVPSLRSNWCGNRVMASLSFDLLASKDLK